MGTEAPRRHAAGRGSPGSTTYNGKPLMLAALASQKRHLAVYLTGIYLSEASRESFQSAYRATGKRLDLGKS